MMRALLSLLFVPVLLTCVAAQPVRIAVLSDASEKDLAALVTTELSGNDAITLIEREDLAKIGDEVKLQQLAGSDAAALGKLAGADGLLFIDKRSDSLYARFTAVNLGYALFDLPVAAKIDPTQEAKTIAHLISESTAKLRLEPGSAIPLSLLNLRADYGTPESLKLERDLTLLLESRLAAVPEYVVLERRHAWSLNFEHSILAPNDPLLRGVWIIDGSISLSSDNDGSADIDLRVRQPNGSESKISVQGSTKDLPALTEQLVSAIQKILGRTTRAAAAPSDAEATEYLREALWGCRSRAPQAALDAVDSAELLGANESDVIGLRTHILAQLINAGMEEWRPSFFIDQKPPAFSNEDLAGRMDLALRAVLDATRYRDENLHDKIHFLKTVSPWEDEAFRPDSLESDVTEAASKLLILLDAAEAPQADQLRVALRPLTKFDPLKGCPGRMEPGNSSGFRFQFADEWSQTTDEEIRFYQLLCTDNELVLPTAMISSPESCFCRRFLATPEARRKAFADFVETLKSRPECRRTYLVLKTHDTDPDIADKAYIDYLSLLSEQRDVLIHSASYTPLVWSINAIAQGVATRNAVAGLPLLHTVLAADPPCEHPFLLLRMLWQPVGFPAKEVPLLWSDVKTFREKHTSGAWAKGNSADPTFDENLDQLLAPLVQKYPDICVQAPLPSSKVRSGSTNNALTITKFWHPWLVPGTKDDDFIIQAWDVSSDGIWLTGNFGSEDGIYHANLTNFTTERVVTPKSAFYQPIKVIGNYLYATYCPNPSSPERRLARYDLKSGTWDSRPLPPLSWLKLFEANGALYLFVMIKQSAETALVRYDWDTGAWIELCNSRRRPALNQFDDTNSMFDIGGIFTGPQHRPCATLPDGTFYIQETPGPWPSVFDDAYFSKVITEQDGTLVISNTGEVTLLSPSAQGPQYLVANTTPHARRLGRRGTPNPRVATPWAAQARWQLQLPQNARWPQMLGFHGGNIYLLGLLPDNDNCELLCYVPGQTEPRHVPLAFHLDDATRAALASPHIRLFTWTPEKLEHPELQFTHFDSSMAYHIVATNQGICLFYMFNGFWFIPYSDIEEFLDRHPPGQANGEVPAMSSVKLTEPGTNPAVGAATPENAAVTR